MNLWIFILPLKYTLLASILFWNIPELNGRHQLCRQFSWVDDPEIPELSPQFSTQISTCINIKVYPVPNSLHLFLTISTSNRYSQCSAFQIDTFAVTVVAQVDPNVGIGQHDLKAVALGTWSPINIDNRNRKNLPPLPPRFPSEYIETGIRHLSTFECASLRSYEEQNDNFVWDFPTYSVPNTLLYNSTLESTKGIAAEAEVTIPSTDFPTPIQIAVEFLITNKTTGDSSYYTWNSKDLILNPQDQNIKWSNSKYNRILYLNPNYYEPLLATTPRTIFPRQTNTSSPTPSPTPSTTPSTTSTTTTAAPTPPPLIPRESYMCDCVNPRRQGGQQSLQITDTLPGSISPCFSFKMASCPDTHTQEQLGAQFIINSQSNGCPAGVKIHDISVIALNDLGFPYGRIAVNQRMKMCFAPGNPIENIENSKPVVLDLNPVEYDCTKYSSSNPQTLYTLPKWLTINASVSSEGSPFPNYEGTLFQFVLQEEVKSASKPQAPVSLQFVAEFGVEETPGSYQMYRILTEHLELAYSASNKVDLQASTILQTDIIPDPTYLGDVMPPPCQPPKPNGGSGPAKPFICECLEKCTTPQPCGAPDPNLKNCFEIEFNPPANPGATLEFYMSFKKKAGGTCPQTPMTVVDTQFTVLVRDVGSTNAKAAGEWSIIEDADVGLYTTPGACIDTASAALKPKQSPIRSIRDCAGTAKQNKGIFWHGRPLSSFDTEIVCARWTWKPSSGGKNMEIQAGFAVIYQRSQGLAYYTNMHNEIYEVAPGGTSVTLIYDKENSRVALVTYETYSRTCVQGPLRRETEMCRCIKPYRPSGQVAAKPVEELDQIAGLKDCFEFKMVGCPGSTTGEALGALWLQNGVKCGRVGLRTLDMKVIAINELGYPYGEIVQNAVANECFDASTSILDYRPVVNEYNALNFPCMQLVKKERALYGNNFPSWVSINVDVESTAAGGQIPFAVQFILNKSVEATSNPHPASLQFIAEFQIKQTANSPVEAYRLATEHRTLAFSNGKVDFAASQVNAAVPRIELHPDYIDEDKPDCLFHLANAKPKPPPNPNWTTCHCFEFEKPGESTVATDAQVLALKGCMEASFNYDMTAGANPTFFVSIAKKALGGNCNDIVIQQFVLTMLGRKRNGRVKTLVPEGKWDRADLTTDYVVGKCYPSGGAGGGSYTPVKTGTTSPKDCAKPVNLAAMYFFYRGLVRDDDVNCAKWEYIGTPGHDEIQVLLKVHFFQKQHGNSLRHVERLPVVFEVNGGKVTKISESSSYDDRVGLFHTANPNEAKNVSCIPTPFVPSSDMCDCTEFRHGGYNQIPERSIVEDLSFSSPPIDPSCFDFTITPCSVDGKEFDTIGAMLIFNGRNQSAACTSNIIVQDVAFVALNGNGYPFGTPQHHEFLRVCLQPADMLQYEIRKMDFSHPIGSECDTRTKPGGGNFKQEFQYGGRTPSWLQVNTSIEIQKLEKPVALQIYLEKPNPQTSATQIQFIAEMVIQSGGNVTDVKIYRIKTQVYDIGYITSGASWKFDPALLAVSTAVTAIERNDMFFETDDANNKKCHVLSPLPRTKVPFPIQNCNCFKFAEGNPPTGVPLNPTSPLYTDKLDKCIFYESTVVQDNGNGDYFFYLTVWSKTVQDEPVCGDFQVVGVTLSQILQQVKPHTTEQLGEPFDTLNVDWERTTMPSSANWVVPDPVKSRGLNCGIHQDYKGKLRRIPPRHDDYNFRCEKTGSVGHGFIFYYPLMNQDDSGNAFCAALKIGSPSLQRDRIEFQISGYFFLDFTVPMGKWFAMKRTFIFEFFKDAILNSNSTPTASTINFPTWVFAVQAPSQVPTDCKTDLCFYE